MIKTSLKRVGGRAASCSPDRAVRTTDYVRVTVAESVQHADLTPLFSSHDGREMLLRARRRSKTSRTCLTLLASYDSSDRMEGAVFEVTDGDLEIADDYETGDYQRSRRRSASGNWKMGNFWSTQKIELVYRTSWRTRDEAENAIFSYIDTWYTTRRIQGAGLTQPRRIRDRPTHPPDQADRAGNRHTCTSRRSGAGRGATR
jgi:hypothetical protein